MSVSANNKLKSSKAIDHLFSKEGFKGLHGEFVIKNNISQQKLNIYKISDKKFLEVF